MPTSLRPYLLRAYFDWIVDNDWTPYLLVGATHPGVEVPAQFVNDGRIVLNVTPRAVRDLEIGNEAITFSARFGGIPHRVFIPIDGVLAIYPQETGQGLSFQDEAPESPAPAITPAPATPQAPATPPPVAVVSSEKPPDEPQPPRRPSLRIVKDK